MTNTPSLDFTEQLREGHRETISMHLMLFIKKTPEKINQGAVRQLKNCDVQQNNDILGTSSHKAIRFVISGWVSRVHHMRESNGLEYSPYAKTRFYEHSVCHWFLKLRQLSSTLMMPIFVNDNLITLLWTMKTAQFNWYHEQRIITNTEFCFLAFFNALQPTFKPHRVTQSRFSKKTRVCSEYH